MLDGRQTFTLCNGINSPVFLITIGCDPEIGISGNDRFLSTRSGPSVRMKEVEEVRTAHDEDEGVRICGVAPASADRSRGGLGATFDRLRGREKVLKQRGRAATVLNDWEWFAMP